MQPIQDDSDGKLKFDIRHMCPSFNGNPHHWQAESVMVQSLLGQEELMPLFQACSQRQRQQMQRGSVQPYGIPGPRLEKCHLNWIPTTFEMVGEIKEGGTALS